jgi:hypothetical protein
LAEFFFLPARTLSLFAKREVFFGFFISKSASAQWSSSLPGIMADTTQEPNLKYLSSVHVLALEALGCLGALYSLAKNSSGPLKPSVDNVEGTVKTVVGPVYQKIEGKPLELLQFLDSKVCCFFQKLCLVV